MFSKLWYVPIVKLNIYRPFRCIKNIVIYSIEILLNNNWNIHIPLKWYDLLSLVSLSECIIIFGPI